MGKPPPVTSEQLIARIGQEIGISPWYLIDQERISAFADVTEDHQFIHIDPERVRRETPYEKPIAHGFLTLSLLSSMYEAALPYMKGSAMNLNYGINHLRFPAPVPVDSRVRGRFLLKSCTQKTAGSDQQAASTPVTWAVTWAVTVEIEGAPKPALVCELIFLDVMKSSDK